MPQVPINDIPSNSHKAQETAAKKDTRPEVVPFEGDVGGAKRKKSNLGAWLKKMFLSDRKPSEILLDVVENQIVPGIKDNVRNSVVTGIDSFIYQNAAPPRTSSNNTVSYNNIFRSQPNLPRPQQPQQTDNQGVDLSNGFVNPCFRTRMEAKNFVDQKMKTYDYPTLSVHTMYMMMRKHIDYTWDAYGWNREEIASWDSDKIVKHIQAKDYPWMVDLPSAHVIS